MLAFCQSLHDTRVDMLKYLHSSINNHPELSLIINTYANPNNCNFIQLLIDCSSLPLVIQAYQLYGKYILNILYKYTRTFCSSMDKARKIVLNTNSISTEE